MVNRSGSPPELFTPKRPVTHTPLDISSIRPFSWMARIGYAARGIVYLMVGGLALVAAGGLGVRPLGIHDALRHMYDLAFGSFLLWIVGVGLACFAVWRFLQTFLDTERSGGGVYGLTLRTIHGCSGLLYLALALASANIALGTSGLSENRWVRVWVEWLLGQPIGRLAVAFVGAGFVAAAAGLAVSALRANFRHRINASPTMRLLAVLLGSFGILTRAVIFLMLGVFLGFAAYDLNAREAIGLTGALTFMQSQSYGQLQLGVVALGLSAYGLFEFIQAFAREIYPPKPVTKTGQSPA
jgi:Domain of Unknown Function (DUF1206)